MIELPVIESVLDVHGDIEVHILADEHLGDRMCDFRRLQERIAYIADNPNAFCVLGGDLMDTAIATSIGDTYAATHSPMEQLRLCEQVFAPVAKKVLGVVHGNHESRIYRYDGIDTTSLMCAQLGISDKYSPTAAVLVIRFGEVYKHPGRPMVYTAYLTHGHGGGKRIGGKINNLEDYSGIVDCDIYIQNHTHSPAAFRQDFFRVDTRNNAVIRAEHLFVNSAANLDYGGYGAVQGFKPASKRSPVIVLHDREKAAEAIV